MTNDKKSDVKQNPGDPGFVPPGQTVKNPGYPVTEPEEKRMQPQGTEDTGHGGAAVNDVNVPRQTGASQPQGARQSDAGGPKTSGK
jgi:hypothetical protein